MYVLYKVVENPCRMKVKKSKSEAKDSKKSEKSRTSAKSTKQAGPVVLVTGTPGTGKSTILKESGHNCLNVSELIKSEGLHKGYNEKFDTFIVNDKKTRKRLLHLIPEQASKGPLLIECHSCGIFDKDEMEVLVDRVLVLRCRTDVIFDRLTARGYSTKKRDENVECEIMGICEEEAREVFASVPVQVFENNTIEDKSAILEYLKSECK